MRRRSAWPFHRFKEREGSTKKARGVALRLRNHQTDPRLGEATRHSGGRCHRRWQQAGRVGCRARRCGRARSMGEDWRHALLPHRRAAVAVGPGCRVRRLRRLGRVRGLPLYPAQEEALIEIVSGANVILSHPDRHRQVARRDRRALRRARAGPAHLLHRADQGAREREVLRPRRHLRRRERRHGHRRLVGQPAMRRSSAARPRSSRTSRCATVPSADVEQVVMDEFHFYADPERGWAWQVPLLTLPHVQFVLMSATLGDMQRHRRRPQPPHRPRDRGRHRRRAPGAARLQLRDHARARDRRGPARSTAGRRSTSCTSRRRRRSSARRR